MPRIDHDLMPWPLVLTLGVLLLAPVRATATDPPDLVASIRPLHGLAAAVMRGIGEPKLLLDGGGSPHGHALRPSQARALQDADLVLVVGAGLDGFVERHLEEGRGPAVLRASEISAIRLLPARRPGLAADEGGGAGPGDGAAHGIDPHLWLDPRNALAVADALADRLAVLDPGRADLYRGNRDELRRRLETLDREVDDLLRPASGRPLVTFHDALLYFTDRYQLADLGSIAADPERAPGARTIRDLRDRLQDLGPVCIALEPGPEPALLEPVREGLPVVLARIDPLGRDIPAGEEHYERLLAELADAAFRCLTAPVPAP